MTDAVLSIQEATSQMIATGQMFEIERKVVKGIEMNVWKNAPATMAQVLGMSLNHSAKEFLIYEDQRYTFEDHYRAAATLAQRFIDLGIKKGDRITIASRNLPQWVMSFWGAILSGAVVVPLNAWWTTEELEYGLSDSGTTIAIVDEERFERISPFMDSLPDLTTVIVLNGTPNKKLNLGNATTRVSVKSFEDVLGTVDPAQTPPEVAMDTDDDATMFYTSGTTGKPKGAVGTHRNALSNMMNLFFIGQRATLRYGTANLDKDGNPVQGSAMLNIPLFHATGCLATMLVNTASGGKLVLSHHFDPTLALEMIQNEKITQIGGVPAIAMQLLDHPNFADYDTSSIRSVSYGGAPPPPELVKRIRAAFPLAQPGNGYGLTETSAAVALNNGADYIAKPASCGPAVPTCEVAIVPEDFEGDEPTADLPKGPDVRGELWIKGPNVVRGYWNKQEATEKAFTKGWLHSGDIARIDEDGFIFIVDRAKDMIIRGGENVYSVIVEAAIFEHPDVADCAVVGVPHPSLGEEVAAVIVLRPGRVVEGEEISRHVAQHLAKFQVPTKVIFRSEPLPRNPQGKVLKRELRDSILG